MPFAIAGARVICFIMMTKILKDILEHAEAWPAEDQKELAQLSQLGR